MIGPGSAGRGLKRVRIGCVVQETAKVPAIEAAAKLLGLCAEVGVLNPACAPCQLFGTAHQEARAALNGLDQGAGLQQRAR